MRDSPDPGFHRHAQQRFVAHVQQLLEDPRLRIQTTGGMTAVTSLAGQVVPGEDTIGVKRKMVELGLFDRDLQRKMPPGQTLDVTVFQTSMFGGRSAVGSLRVLCLSPVEALLKGKSPSPLTAADVSRALAAQPPPLNGLPQTLIVVSTSGFADDARRLVERGRTRTVLLTEINDAGGWSTMAPEATGGIAELLDPETDAEKRQRVIDDLEISGDLLGGGASAATLAQRLHIPRPLVEQALREYAKMHPGLAARTIEGTLVLYREGLGISAGPTGENMPFWEKIKGIFVRGESREKKVGRLAQERAVLSEQRKQAYGEVETVENREKELTASFGTATPTAQKRIATEIAQLRKRVERIQQLVSTIDKKINIVETGMHNLEMEHQLSADKLETLENVAQASEQVDVGMATLDQLSEQADAVSVVGSEMSSSAQDVLAELQAKFAEKPVVEPAAQERTTTGPQKTPAARAAVTPPPLPGERRRVPGAAEPG